MLITSLLLCAAAAPQPSVPSEWMADLNLETVMKGVKRKAFGTFAYDVGGKRQWYKTPFNMSSVAPAQWVGTGKDVSNVEQWVVVDGMYTGLNGREYLVSPLGFDKAQQFVWLPMATYIGETTVNGVAVHQYDWTQPTYGIYNKYYSSVSSGAPVREVLNYTKLDEYLRFDFSNLRDLDPSVFNSFDKTAAYQPPVCEVISVDPIVIDAYVFHPRTEYNVSGQNVADIAGDTSFVCLDALSNNTKNDHYDVVSWYKVKVLPVWGRYQPCNGYPSLCTGGASFYVGREVSFGLTQNGGQCSEADLAEVGSWWSLPTGGVCGPKATPGDGSCTWKVETKVKTIDAVQCLFKQQGMLSQCKKEGRMPYPQTQKIFSAAFTETDPSAGGCPDIHS